MTNFIEEMMKTAGVTKHTIEICTKICPTKNLACEERTEINLETTHPDFTAEKQIEVIKLLATNNIAFKKSDINNGWVFATFAKKGYAISENQNFTQALAEFTTNLMDKGELDKQKVKEILE